jgi:hypothetical protein
VDPGPQRLMLHELAAKVARGHCERRDQAIAVLNGEEPPPPEWAGELQERRERYVDRELDIARKDFVTETTGAPRSLEERAVWLRQGETRASRLAQAEAKWQQKHEARTRAWAEARAGEIAAGNLAQELADKATEAILHALGSAMMDQGAEVWATPEGGERRRLDRAEIAEAEIDFITDSWSGRPRNRLKIRGRLWCDVEVVGAPLSDADMARDPLPSPERQRQRPGRSPSPKAPQLEVDQWYEQEYVPRCLAEGRSPNTTEDEAAARAHFGKRYDRDKLRSARSRLAKAEWSSPQKSKGKRQGP